MTTRTVEMTDEAAAILDSLIAKGRFANREAAMAEALTLLGEDDATMDAFVEGLTRSYHEALAVPPSAETGQEQVERIVREAKEEWEAKAAVRARRVARRAS